VQLVDLTLDNRISISFIETSAAENVIFCRPLEENLNNVSVITTKDAEFVHSFLTESTGNYLVADVTLPNGDTYNSVKFRVVTIEEGKRLPPSIFNTSLLGKPSSTDKLPPVQLIKEDYERIAESVQEEQDDFSELYNIPEVVDNTEIIQKVKVLESKLI
jgi:hypothetical protein